MKYKIILIFGLAFLVRLIGINQSLWLDEATTARVVQQYSFAEILNQFSINDFHPPLYYLVLKLWTNFFGYSEIALRMPSLIFSLLTGCFVYGICKLHKGLVDPNWAVVLFLFNPLIIYYSQEARMYLLTTFLLTGALFYFSKINQLESAPKKDKIEMIRVLLLFSVFSFLALLTFYGSIFMIVSLLIYLTFKVKFKLFFLLMFVVATAMTLLFPLLFHQLINARQQLNLVPNWSTALGGVNLKNLLLIPLKFSIGRISYEPKWFYWLTAGLWTGIVAIFTTRGSLTNKRLAYLFIMPLFLGVLFSFFTPLLQYFRFIYLIPILSILIALGRYKRYTSTVKWIVATGFAIYALIYLLIPSFHREDWKSLVKSLPKNSKVYMIASSSDPVKYYENNLKVIDLKKLPKQLKDKEIFVIPYTTDIHGVDYRKNLDARDYKLVAEKSFRGLTLEKWQL